MIQKNNYMLEAIRQAKKSLKYNDVPVGCVIVLDDKIIAKAYNKRHKNKNTLSHCEIIAIDKACKKIGDWRLENCTMYVTLEPCAMCAGAILQSRMKKVVIGATNPRFGCCGSIINILDNSKFNHKVEIEIGMLQKECSAIITNFFKEMRGNGKKDSTF